MPRRAAPRRAARRTGVAHQQAVDVAAQVGAVLKVALAAADELQREAALDERVAVDGGRDGGGEALQDVGPRRLLLDQLALLLRWEGREGEGSGGV